jgi:hypothetical protein
MQWLGAFTLLGLLVGLLLAAKYFGDTQKTPNRRPGSALDDFYHAKGMGNVLNAQDKLNEIASEQRRNASSHRHRHS